MIRLASAFATVALALSSLAAPPLVWKPVGDARRALLPQVPDAPAGFTRIDPGQSGIHFTNVLLESRKLANANLMNGSGVALGDYDGDGLCDIYFCDLNGTNKLFRNLGDWRFRDVTEETGTACPKQTSTGAVFADLDGDSRLDLLVTSMGGPHACFLNLGNGRFTNITARAGITSRWGATSMALADIDGNGTLDLYVADYGVTSILRSGGALNLSYENGKPVVRGRYAQRVKIIDSLMWELGEPDMLYLNDGKANFTAVSWTNGVFTTSSGAPLKPSEVPWDQGLSVVFRDINRDGYPDIYVCNDAFTPDRLWINDGKGHFQAASTLQLRTTSHFAMGVDFGDLNRDGTDEFLVLDMLSRQHRFIATQKGNMPSQPYVPGDLETQWQMRRNTLLISDGCGGFSDIAFYAGVAGSEWSWGAIFLDVDLDGWEDILITNGFEHNTDDMDIQEKARAQSRSVAESRRNLTSLYPVLLTPNVAFRNKRDLTFEETGKKWGFDATEVSNGMALADLDNDGDLDVVVNCMNAAPLLYRNNSPAPRLAVRLKGKTPNTGAIGARITVEGGPVTQSQEVMAGGRYVSGDDPMRVFSGGSATNRLTIKVAWRDGTISTITGAEPGYVYEIDQAGAKTNRGEKAAQPAAKPQFVEAKTNQKHGTDGFDDFAQQPALPFHLNAFGPGIIFSDINGDGSDDLITGAGRAGGLLISTNHEGKWVPVKSSLPKDAAGGLLIWPRSATEQELLISLENLARPSTNNIRSFRVSKDGTLAPSASDAVFQAKGAGGPLALAEVQGEMTLFWGARFAPGRYPESASSHLYRFRNNQWELDVKNETILAKLGLVSGAVWSDLDADGTPELIVACQWSPIRVFSVRDSVLVERTEDLGFAAFSGLWQSVATADFDGDGQMDIVAGNWGLNSSYNQAADHQVQLYFGEFSAPGQMTMLEAYFDPQMSKAVPWRDKRVLSTDMPWLNEKFVTHAEFAKAGMDEILKGRSAPRILKAATLASAVFLNRGSRFEHHALPATAQFAPVFGIVAADFDNDGTNDLFLAQNFFAVREFDSRLDAGRGLLLKGNGRGDFSPVAPAQSGLQIYGEQRGCAAGDFNGDGRLDVAVAQYANDTRLFVNQNGPAGIRLRLKGEAKNLAAAGAQFQVGDQRGWGVVQEIQLGSGYWSQNSLTKIAVAPRESARIRVRWPGTKAWAETNLPAGQQFEIARDGSGLVARAVNN